MSSKIWIRATQYTVSLLPEDHHDFDLYAIRVERRCDGEQSWAVVLRGHWLLGADRLWSAEPIPPDRTDAWLAKYRFDLRSALALAQQAAPEVRCNGRTAAQVLNLT